MNFYEKSLASIGLSCLALQFLRVCVW
uniref:Uncharacterized protein n=1 Tax=Rhizophora mucronata TaxID=61149 RepID=A0A2P2Q2C0_RHIMU